MPSTINSLRYGSPTEVSEILDSCEVDTEMLISYLCQACANLAHQLSLTQKALLELTEEVHNINIEGK